MMTKNSDPMPHGFQAGSTTPSSMQPSVVTCRTIVSPTCSTPSLFPTPGGFPWRHLPLACLLSKASYWTCLRVTSYSIHCPHPTSLLYINPFLQAGKVYRLIECIPGNPEALIPCKEAQSWGGKGRRIPEFHWPAISIQSVSVRAVSYPDPACGLTPRLYQLS